MRKKKVTNDRNLTEKGAHETSLNSSSKTSSHDPVNFGNQRSTSRRIQHRTTWQGALAKSRGEYEAAKLMERVQIRFNDLYSSRPHVENQALRIHLESSILPGLALYQTLLEEGSDPATVVQEWKRLFTARLARNPKSRLLRMLQVIPHPFRLFRWANRRTMTRQFPSQGWTIEWLEDSRHCLAFNIHACFYLDVLTALCAPELTKYFCEMDDVMFADLPASITWERTKTLATGGDSCDFCWRNVESDNNKNF